jgi:ABC-type Fe3+/spermidine/putrescine transport system ATPase subunit
MADRVALHAGRRGPADRHAAGAVPRGRKTRFVAEFLGETNLIHAERIDQATLEVEAGRFHAKRLEHASVRADTKQITISIRPEATRIVRLGEAGSLPGRLIETTYLGETAQHLVEVKGCPAVKVAEMNPFGSSSRIHPNPGDPVGVVFDAGEIVPLDPG